MEVEVGERAQNKTKRLHLEADIVSFESHCSYVC